MLAAAGITGPPLIFEGAMGFERLVSGSPINPQVDRWAKQRAEDFMILKTGIKFLPAVKFIRRLRLKPRSNCSRKSLIPFPFCARVIDLAGRSKMSSASPEPDSHRALRQPHPPISARDSGFSPTVPCVRAAYCRV
jgi:hypothetical protein